MTPEQVAEARRKYDEADADERRRMERDGLAALAGNAGWFAVVAPWIEKRAYAARDNHESESKTPLERAEWLHAMKITRDMEGLVEKELEKRRESRVRA